MSDLRMITASFILGIAILGVSDTSLRAQQTMTNERVKALLDDRTVDIKFLEPRGSITAGGVGVLYADPNGPFWMSCCTDNGFKARVRGNWWAENGKFCRYFKLIDDTTCYEVTETDGRVTRIGPMQALRVRKGDQM